MKTFFIAILLTISSFAHSSNMVVVNVEQILNDYYNDASILQNDHLAHGIMKRLAQQFNNVRVVLKWESYRRSNFLGQDTYVMNPINTNDLKSDYRVREIIDFSEIPLTTCYVLEDVRTGEVVAKSAVIGRIRSHSCGPSCDTIAAPAIKSAKFRAHALMEMLNTI